MSKHYIRVNGNKEITKAFSDFYEKPETGDICIEENESTDWGMNLHEITQYGFKYKYLYDRNIIREKTIEELAPTQVDLDRRISWEAQTKMAEIDGQTIPEIRKYIAGLAGCPSSIKTLETQYQIEKAKVV